MENPIKKIEELQAYIQELEKSNESLRMQLAEKRKGKRDLFNSIKNYEKATKLCAIAGKDGRLYKSMANFPGNFQTLYKNIFRALNPTTIEHNGHNIIRYSSLDALSDHDWNVHKECLEACIEAIYDAKARLEKCEKIATSVTETKGE